MSSLPNSDGDGDGDGGGERKRTVLITGCSQHGLGHALALAFHDAGFRVFATARNPERMVGLNSQKRPEIECLKMDVCDDESIKECVAKVRDLTKEKESNDDGDDGEDGDQEKGRLDCLVNNAGGGMYVPNTTPQLKLFAYGVY